MEADRIAPAVRDSNRLRTGSLAADGIEGVAVDEEDLSSPFLVKVWPLLLDLGRLLLVVSRKVTASARAESVRRLMDRARRRRAVVATTNAIASMTPSPMSTLVRDERRRSVTSTEVPRVAIRRPSSPKAERRESHDADSADETGTSSRCATHA